MQYMECCHDIANHFVSVQLCLEGTKIIPEFEPWRQLVVLDPPQAFTVLRNFSMEPGLQAIHKCRENHSQTVGKRVGLAD